MGITGEVELALDEEGVDYYRVPLSNGAVLRLYGNGLALEGSDNLLAYEDLVEILRNGRTMLVVPSDEDPFLEA